MVIGLIGESCVGKSTIANRLKTSIGATVYSGKDYLRMDKNPTNAMQIFKNLLKDNLATGNINQRKRPV